MVRRHTSSVDTMVPAVITRISLLLLAVLIRQSEQLCAPDCTNADPGTSVRDPTDCTKYYVCLLVNGEVIPSQYPVSCPDDQYFNVGHTVPRCDPIHGAPAGFCAPLCDPCVPDCDGTNAGSLQPHPLDCTKYYICLAKESQEGAKDSREGGGMHLLTGEPKQGHFVEESCPPGTYYDFMTGLCQDDLTLCYHYCDPCVPHCTANNQKIIDPNDCRRFYLCTPPTMSSFLCPHESMFNIESGECDADECVIQCGGGDGEGLKKL